MRVLCFDGKSKCHVKKCIAQMANKIEACSVVDGAWYEVIPETCQLVYHKRVPFVRMKYADFDYSECELYKLEHFYEQRFRVPFKLAQLDTDLVVGQNIVGFAVSGEEGKWYDATVERIVRTEEDTRVTVDWRLGYYFLTFGIPKTTVLSVDKGEVGIAGEVLDPEQHPVISDWIKALREVSGSEEEFENCEVRFPFDAGAMTQSLFMSNIDHAPSSLSQSSSAKRKRPNGSITSPKN